MEINRVEGQIYYENMGSAKAKRGKSGSFYENLSENLNGRNSQKPDVNTVSAASASAAVNKAYRYHNISSATGIFAGGRITADGVYESEAKNISYEESDYVKASVESGYTLMAQVDISARSVYVEQKTDDGMVKGYNVDIDKLNKDDKEPIVNAAYEAWQKAVSADEDSKDADVELSVEEALLGFYEFIEDRIKNGPPKYLIGNSEFSVEEWDKFLESIDGQIDDIKEEVKELIEEMKEQQKEKQAEAESTRGIDAITAYAMETRLTSGIIGFGGLEDGTVYSASYDESSTMGNSIINIRMESRSGEVKTYKVSVNQVDCSNATQLEMFALCSHADKLGMTGSSGESKSYSNLLHYAQNSTFGNQTSKTADDFMSAQKNWNSMVSDSQIDKMEKEGKIDSSIGKNLQSIFETIEKFNSDSNKAGVSRTKLEEQALLEQKKKYDSVPYGHLAKDGVIEYNGVTFVCDAKHNAIHLGDTSNPKDCIRVSLSKGGSLIVNRDNLDDLAKAIGMFSPEDVNLIMRAIAQDAKIQQMEKEIDDMTSGIGEAGETDAADIEDGEKENDTF